MFMQFYYSRDHHTSKNFTNYGLWFYHCKDKIRVLSDYLLTGVLASKPTPSILFLRVNSLLNGTKQCHTFLISALGGRGRWICELQANPAYWVPGQLVLVPCSKPFNGLQDSVMIWPFLALQTQILPITFFLLQSNWLSYWPYSESETSPHFVTLHCPLLETLLPQASGWHVTQAFSSFPAPSLILPLNPDPLPSLILTLFRH